MKNVSKNKLIMFPNVGNGEVKNDNHLTLVTCQLFAVIIFSVLLIACNRKHHQADASGVFEAKEILVSAKGSGEIFAFNLEEGQQVVALEPLGYIDTTQLYLKKLQLQLSAKAIKNQLVDISKQTAALEQQIETAKTEKKRIENLFKSEAATPKQLDDVNAQIAVLEKQLEAAKTSMTQANNGVSDTESSMAVQIAQINDQIKNSIIQSPINGTILTKYAEQGELAMPGKVLFKVADMENIFLRVYVTADQLTNVKTGQQVTVFADQGKSDQKKYEGTITWISDKAEFTPKTILTKNERASLVYAIKVLVKNDGYLRKGMYGEMQN
ncbi:MAG: HlyD family efflux transporter periplasmic adaptor subunit [Bacteroidales bacterium]|jgi:HlyD family secretion protein|nr:HlyD family efflux transporter periplasmic adaptor subunit [Bacteroidales bacterium]